MLEVESLSSYLISNSDVDENGRLHLRDCGNRCQPRSKSTYLLFWGESTHIKGQVPHIELPICTNMEILVHNLSQTGITVTQSNQYFKPRLISPRSSGEVIFKSLRPRCQGGTIICREVESSAPICEMGAAQFERRTSNGWIMLKDKKSVRSQWKLFLYKVGVRFTSC